MLISPLLNLFFPSGLVSLISVMSVISFCLHLWQHLPPSFKKAKNSDQWLPTNCDDRFLSTTSGLKSSTICLQKWHDSSKYETALSVWKCQKFQKLLKLLKIILKLSLLIFITIKTAKNHFKVIFINIHKPTIYGYRCLLKYLFYMEIIIISP